MKYIESITDFFKSPKWGMNLLLSAVCFIIPVVGPLVLNGWHITGFWARKDERDPAKFPDFDFGLFSKYLERGLWPFLVSLVVAVVLVPVLVIAMFVVMGVFGGLAGGSSNETGGILAMVGMLIAFGLYGVFMLAMLLVQVPLLLRATMTQDFKEAFNFAFLKHFIGVMWKELLIAALFMLVAGGVLLVVGMLACYIGMFFTMPLAFYSWAHLQKQLYELYLSRGGQVIPVSPKLTDLPPSIPV